MKKRFTLKKISYLMIALGVATFLYVGYFDIYQRYTQNAMQEQWNGRNSSKTTQKLLKVERKGPNKDQLGILTIPKLGVKQVVLFDSTKENLIKGPSVIKGTAYPGTLGNSAIAGHRVSYGHPFRNIHKLKKGDKIEFSNSYGKVVYTVDENLRVDPDDTRVLYKTDHPRITLVSCDPPYSAKYRLIVVATMKQYKK